jgi:hypothetical protein
MAGENERDPERGEDDRVGSQTTGPTEQEAKSEPHSDLIDCVTLDLSHLPPAGRAGMFVHVEIDRFAV